MAVELGVRHNRRVFEIGASLREARVRRGLSPAEVHKAIRIRDRYLQALEDERWELLPGDAYVKGFLRTYADFLGLDGNLYVDEYSSRIAQPEDRPLAPQPLSRAELGSRRGAGVLRPLVAIAVLVAIVAAVAAWQLYRPSKHPAQTTSGRTTTRQTTSPRKKHRKRHAIALPSKATLVAAHGATWLDVRYGSANGRVIYENTLPQGQKVSVSLTHGPVWIRVGLPTNLDVHLGGRLAHGLPTSVGNVVLTRRGLRPG